MTHTTYSVTNFRHDIKTKDIKRALREPTLRDVEDALFELVFMADNSFELVAEYSSYSEAYSHANECIDIDDYGNGYCHLEFSGVIEAATYSDDDDCPDYLDYDCGFPLNDEELSHFREMFSV